MYIIQYINLNFQKLFWEVNILYAVFVKYALINFRSPNQCTISIDLPSIRISIRIISIRISKQSKHRNQQAKGERESALNCIKKNALCCMLHKWSFYKSYIGWKSNGSLQKINHSVYVVIYKVKPGGNIYHLKKLYLVST